MVDYPKWLDTAGRAIFKATLPALDTPSNEQLEMLAAYAHAMANLQRVRGDKGRAAQWRKAMLYARNGLGIGPRVFVDLLEILLDWHWMDDKHIPYEHLKREWQLPESQRPRD